MTSRRSRKPPTAMQDLAPVTGRVLSKVPAVEKRVRALPPVKGPPQAEVWGRILARRLRGDLDTEVEVTITDNTRTMVAFHRERRCYRVRLHHMFLGARDEVITALGFYLRGEEAGAELVDGFIESHRHLIRAVTPGARQRRARIRPRGAHHDLSKICARLNASYFEGAVRATITWAIVPRVSRRRKSIKLGSYSEDAGIIRIHPALDHPAVPSYFVEWIVFHELLHVVEGAEARGGRRVVHTESFRRREESFGELGKAKEWERDHIDWLLAWQPRANRHLGSHGQPE